MAVPCHHRASMSRRAHRPAALAAALAFTVLGGCLSLRGTAERPAVRKLELQGAKQVPAAELLDRLATTRSGRFFWDDVAHFDADVFAIDQRRILAFYRSRGFYDARIAAAEVTTSGAGDRVVVDVRIRVEEGAPVRVADVRIEGLEQEPEALARLGPARKLPIAAGDVFREDRLDAGRAAILKALAGNGYPRPEVEQLAEVDPAARTARVRYTVRAGGRYRLGGLFVSGTAEVPREKVREAAGTALKAGEWFDAGALPKAQGKVFDLGVFGGIRVNPGQPDDRRGTIPVVIAVREAPFRTLRFGPSVGIEAARWDASLVAGWSHRNWLGGLRKLSLDLRVGWSWIQSPFKAEKQGPAGLAAADFTQPNVWGQVLDFTTRVELERRIEAGYQYWAERLRLGLPLRIVGRTLVLVPTVNFEYYQTTGDPTKAEVGGSSQILLSCPEDSLNPTGTQRCLLSYLEQRVDLDLRDDPLNTRAGAFLSLSLQEGFRTPWGGFRYVRLVPELRAFLPLGETVLAARGRVGFLQPLGGDQLPIIARLSSGGPGQMRGYYTKRLSPVVAMSNGSYSPVGGTGLLDGSVEARIPLGGNVGGVAFVDAGNVELAVKDLWQVDRLQWAVGLGLRYKSLFGPIRFDLAGRLPRREGGRWVVPTVPVVRIERGEVVPTGEVHSEPLLAFHFSIGEAF